MNNNLTIAAIVPVYNTAQYLERCVDSLIHQTYQLKEIILIDDGSIDSSPSICDRYASEDSRIRVVHKQNGGLGFARNTGLKQVDLGIDYVTFVDSDDWLEPETIETLAAALVENGCDTVLAGFTRRDNEGVSLSKVELKDKLYDGDEVRRALLPRVCGSAPHASDSLPMSICASLLSMKLIRDKGLAFLSERVVLSEDYFFKFSYLSHAKKVYVSECTGYCYRFNRKSLTTSYRVDRFEAALHFYALAKELASTELAAEECTIRLQKSLFIYVRWSIAQEALATSGHTPHQARRRIKEITSNAQLQAVIGEYPVKALGYAQRIFVLLVKHRCASILYLLARSGAFAEAR